MSRNFSKRKSFKMTVLQHELKYLLISFQQTSVTSIKLSERVKLTKHVFSSLTSGQKFFQGTTMSVFRSCVVLALLRIKEIPMHHSASLSLLPFPLVELEFFSLQNVTVTTTTLSWAGCHFS